MLNCFSFKRRTDERVAECCLIIVHNILGYFELKIFWTSAPETVVCGEHSSSAGYNRKFIINIITNRWLVAFINACLVYIKINPVKFNCVAKRNKSIWYADLLFLCKQL